VLGGRSDQFERDIVGQEVREVEFGHIVVAELGVQTSIGAGGGSLDVTAFIGDHADAAGADQEVARRLGLEGFLSLGHGRSGNSENRGRDSSNGTGHAPGTKHFGVSTIWIVL
jgi:hypothetical protein